MKAVLEIREVTKVYWQQVTLHPLSIAFSKGRTVTLLGPSGCGKSTLIRLLIGLVKPDRGEVVVFGEHLTSATERRIRHRMGYVIQEGGLFPHLTARDNVAHLARHLGWSESRIKACSKFWNGRLFREG